MTIEELASDQCILITNPTEFAMIEKYLRKGTQYPNNLPCYVARARDLTLGYQDTSLDSDEQQMQIFEFKSFEL